MLLSCTVLRIEFFIVNWIHATKEVALMKKWHFVRYLSMTLVLVLLLNMYPIQSMASASSGESLPDSMGTQIIDSVSSGDSY